MFSHSGGSIPHCGLGSAALPAAFGDGVAARLPCGLAWRRPGVAPAPPPPQNPPMNHLAQYTGLFFAAFLSATIVPFQSEVVLFGMLLTHHYQAWLLVLVASVGNILGS